MNPTYFPESNLLLTAPPSMPECLPLPVRRCVATEDKPGSYISCWEPTSEERAIIAAGGPVWVYVVGDGAPPPIAVSGVIPFVANRARLERIGAEDDAEVEREVVEGLLSHLEAQGTAPTVDAVQSEPRDSEVKHPPEKAHFVNSRIAKAGV